MRWPMIRTRVMMISSKMTGWPLPDGVNIAITSRRTFPSDGCSLSPFDRNNMALHVGDNADAVQHNRQQLLRQLPDVRAIQWLRQVHGTEVVTACSGSVVLTADAVLTDQPGLACAVMTADCLPVLLAADDGCQVAAIHAGWRSLAAGIITKTLAHFSRSGGVCAYLGPAIGPEHFEVGPEVKTAFSWASGACFRSGREDRLLADLKQLATEALQMQGVKRIYGGAECTVTMSDEYYSYRRDGVTGRMASLIWKTTRTA